MRLDVKLDPAQPEVWVTILAPEESEELEALLLRISETDSTLLGFQGERAAPLPLGDVLRFYGEDKAVRAQTVTKEVYTVRQRLYELESQLTAQRFVRISHSEIVNWKRVESLDLGLTGTIRVTLTGGVVTYVSRRYVKKIKEVLGL